MTSTHSVVFGERRSGYMVSPSVSRFLVEQCDNATTKDAREIMKEQDSVIHIRLVEGKNQCH